VVEEGIEVIPLRSSTGRLSPLLAQQTGQPTVHRKTLRAIFRAGRFDVVHFHNSSLVGGPGVFGLARPATTIYSAHEHWLVCPTHVLWRHKREVCPARQCIRCQLRYHRPPQLWRYSSRLRERLDNIDVYIAMSEFSRAKHAEFGFPREMQVLPPFADAPLDSKSDVSPHPRPYFFYAGRLEQIKGVQTIIPQIAKVSGVDLVIAGDGSMRRELERMAGASVHFLGAVDSRKLAGYYRHALATVVPSTTYETFGLALIESFSNGTPVVARRLGPLPEIVDTCNGGLTFSDDEELLACLTKLAGNAELREKLGANARAGFETNWSESAIMPRYLDIVEAAVTRNQ
jgi:glycosyltransferase involved in cell wall biosynthesis